MAFSAAHHAKSCRCEKKHSSGSPLKSQSMATAVHGKASSGTAQVKRDWPVIKKARQTLDEFVRIDVEIANEHAADNDDGAFKKEYSLDLLESNLALHVGVAIVSILLFVCCALEAAEYVGMYGLEGRYADICCLCARITEAVAEGASRETMCSLPHHVVPGLKRSILADIRRTRETSFPIMTHKHNGKNMRLQEPHGRVRRARGGSQENQEPQRRHAGLRVLHGLGQPREEYYAGTPQGLAKRLGMGLQTNTSYTYVIVYHHMMNVYLYLNPYSCHCPSHIALVDTINETSSLEQRQN